MQVIISPAYKPLPITRCTIVYVVCLGGICLVWYDFLGYCVLLYNVCMNGMIARPLL